jgi:hypothetical protein
VINWPLWQPAAGLNSEPQNHRISNNEFQRKDYLFGILNLDNWNLFEPALARLAMFQG